MRFTRVHNRRDRRFACALDRAQPVADLPVTHRHEAVITQIDIGRQHLKMIRKTILVENMHLVGVVHFRRQGSGHECRRVMRLEISRLVCHHGIRRGMRFVETVFRKFFHQPEELLRLPGPDPVLHRAQDKNTAVLGHFVRLLLAHRATQQIGRAQTVAAQHLGDLHDLFLVHDHAVSRFKHRFELGMKVFRSFHAVLALDEIVHHARLQRPRAVQRHQRDQVFKAIRFQPALEVLGAF